MTTIWTSLHFQMFVCTAKVKMGKSVHSRGTRNNSLGSVNDGGGKSIAGGTLIGSAGGEAPNSGYNASLKDTTTKISLSFLPKLEESQELKKRRKWQLRSQQPTQNRLCTISMAIGIL